MSVLPSTDTRWRPRCAAFCTPPSPGTMRRLIFTTACARGSLPWAASISNCRRVSRPESRRALKPPRDTGLRPSEVQGLALVYSLKIAPQDAVAADMTVSATWARSDSERERSRGWSVTSMASDFLPAGSSPPL